MSAIDSDEERNLLNSDDELLDQLCYWSDNYKDDFYKLTPSFRCDFCDKVITQEASLRGHCGAEECSKLRAARMAKSSADHLFRIESSHRRQAAKRHKDKAQIQSASEPAPAPLNTPKKPTTASSKKNAARRAASKRRAETASKIATSPAIKSAIVVPKNSGIIPPKTTSLRTVSLGLTPERPKPKPKAPKTKPPTKVHPPTPTKPSPKPKPQPSLNIRIDPKAPTTRQISYADAVRTPTAPKPNNPAPATCIPQPKTLPLVFKPKQITASSIPSSKISLSEYRSRMQVATAKVATSTTTTVSTPTPQPVRKYRRLMDTAPAPYPHLAASHPNSSITKNPTVSTEPVIPTVVPPTIPATTPQPLPPQPSAPAVQSPKPIPMEIDQTPQPPAPSLPLPPAPLCPPPGFPVPKVVTPHSAHPPLPTPLSIAGPTSLPTFNPFTTDRPMQTYNTFPTVFTVPQPIPLPLPLPLPSPQPLPQPPLGRDFHSEAMVLAKHSYIYSKCLEAIHFDGTASEPFEGTWGLRADFFDSASFTTDGRVLYDHTFKSALDLLVCDSGPDAAAWRKFFIDLILEVENFYKASSKRLKTAFDSIIQSRKRDHTCTGEDVRILRAHLRSNQCAISVRRKLIQDTLRRLNCITSRQYTGDDLLQVLRELSYLTFMNKNVTPSPTRS